MRTHFRRFPFLFSSSLSIAMQTPWETRLSAQLDHIESLNSQPFPLFSLHVKPTSVGLVEHMGGTGTNRLRTIYSYVRFPNANANKICAVYACIWNRQRDLSLYFRYSHSPVYPLRPP